MLQNIFPRRHHCKIQLEFSDLEKAEMRALYPPCCREIIEIQHQACILGTNYYLSGCSVHSKLALSTE